MRHSSHLTGCRTWSAERKTMIEREPEINVRRQFELLGLRRIRGRRNQGSAGPNRRDE